MYSKAWQQNQLECKGEVREEFEIKLRDLDVSANKFLICTVANLLGTLWALCI
jgi:hypothetical protein